MIDTLKALKKEREILYNIKTQYGLLLELKETPGRRSDFELATLQWILVQAEIDQIEDAS